MLVDLEACAETGRQLSPITLNFAKAGAVTASVTVEKLQVSFIADVRQYAGYVWDAADRGKQAMATAFPGLPRRSALLAMATMLERHAVRVRGGQELSDVLWPAHSPEGTGAADCSRFQL